MELLKFSVRNQHLSGGGVRLVSDSIDYVEAKFDFKTEEWNGLSKWAHFFKGEEVYDINLADDRITREMHLNLKAGEWDLKLHGTDPEGTMRVTTDSVRIYVDSYGSTEDGMPLPEIPLSAAEQIDARAQAAVETANEARSYSLDAFYKAEAVEEAAARGEFDGKKGEPGITPKLQMGAVETLEAGENAIATLGGTTEKPILNLGIPMGYKGDKGDKGDGGKSAFEYAVEGGYEKSEEDFYKDLSLYEERMAAVEAEIEDLKYVDIVIESFGHNAGVRELGEEVRDIAFSWELNKDAEKVTLNGEEMGTSQFGDHIKHIAQPNPGIKVTTSFELVATGRKGETDKKNANLYFYNGIYYGAGAFENLTKVLSNTRKRTFTVNAAEGENIFYAYPARLGESTFKVGGFEGGFDLIMTQDMTNDFGYTESYYVYSSTQAGLGETTVEVS